MIEKLKNIPFKGQIFDEDLYKKLYSVDASAYREIPLAVAYPADEEDITSLVKFAHDTKIPLIPRAAGTSLAGQVVGKGIVVDISRFMTKVLETNPEEGWVRVQPGVIRDDLNKHLKDFNLFFGPETSTANRAMIGGMIGNNSCGSNSIVYGSTREHLIEVKAVLSDGSTTTFKAVSPKVFDQKCKQDNLEGEIYRNINDLLAPEENRKEIELQYPKRSIPRRNTGYALDLLMDSAPFNKTGEDFNFCKIIAGSEGTLAFITEAKIKTVPIPSPNIGLLCIHFKNLYDSLKATLTALKYDPSACELMDHYILDRTKGNIEHRQNRFFIEGDPEAILVVELRGEDMNEVEQKVAQLTEQLKKERLGYHFPLVTGENTKRVWELRKAGLGLLSNMPGDAKPVPVIEDTAVDVQDLPAYIKEFNEQLKKHGLFCVHYAHAGSGELHLRPIINLKTKEGNELFRTVATEVAALVKKYRGSLSGEHGDGRLRGEFIPFMIGDKCYQMLKEVKKSWDPDNIFNPGKIVDTPSMNSFLRFEPEQHTPEYDTIFDFKQTKGIVRAVEQCNGSGDCRKTHLSGGTMCPSYMATKNEKDTTRGRANIIREALNNPQKLNAFDNKEIMEVLDLCLSCKGCTSECPSNVDIARVKAEAQYQYYKENGFPLRNRLMANIGALNKIGSKFPGITNLALKQPLLKKFMGIAPQRSLPPVYKHSLISWYKKNKANITPSSPIGKVYFFCDEFTNYNDTEIGIKAIKLLSRLNYEVEIPDHSDSGRAAISKGLLMQAKKQAEKNVRVFEKLISEETPLIGLEPSAILSFRDEYPALVEEDLKKPAAEISENVLLLEEFIGREFQEGRIKHSSFTDDKKLIRLHGHCHQKALSTMVAAKKTLMLPQNYEVLLIPSGCCGMAGSFGYEKEHYDVSQQIGELVLFPTIRKLSNDVIIAAAGTSCRHQIYDGTGRIAKHPAEILWEALKEM
ncbi:MAG: FAD-binding and (Fe-S)-binding domain-containing protein [Candidatus Cyclobacteriaceae bacterium M2_1C_046]